jgi:hypothetical protein
MHKDEELESLALLRILSLSAKDFEEGRARPAREVFADLRAEAAERAEPQ